MVLQDLLGIQEKKVLLVLWVQGEMQEVQEHEDQLALKVVWEVLDLVDLLDQGDHKEMRAKGDNQVILDLQVLLDPLGNQLVMMQLHYLCLLDKETQRALTLLVMTSLPE